MALSTGYVVVNGVKEKRPLREYNGLLIREGTMDAYIIHEIERSYGWLDVEGRAVMDIGACFGAFSCWAIRNGARHLLAVEPDFCNYELLWENIHRTMLDGHSLEGYYVLNYAVSNILGTTQLWHPPRGVNTGTASTTEFRGRTSSQVDTIPFREYAIDHNIEIVKCDCEGAEYEFLNGQEIPSDVREIAAEIHLSKRSWRDIQGPKLVESFKAGGWEEVREPKIGEKNWTTLGGWRRQEIAVV